MENEHIIMIEVQNPGQLLIGEGRILNDSWILKKEVEEFLVEKAEMLPPGASIILQVQIHEGAFNKIELEKSIRSHFKSCMIKAQKQKKLTLRLGWRNLLIGFAFLVAIYFLTRFLFPQFPESGIMITVRELFIILGWVALWRPAELLLYEWYPFKKQANLYGKLSRAKVRTSIIERGEHQMLNNDY